MVESPEGGSVEVRQPTAWYTRFVRVVLVVAVVVLLLAALVLGPRNNRPSGRSACLNNIRQLTLALHNYVSVHGHFPPAYSVDKDGRPLHSWRTLILPYLDQGGQYRAIDLTKPWDDPVNAAFAFPVPDIFRCPGVDAAADDPTTNYIGVVGKETAWKPGGETITFSDGSDGCSMTIAIIESTNHRVHWMAPDNLKYAELLRLIKREGDATIQSPHPGGFNTGWLDGSYRWFSNEDVVEGLPAALTIAGGEGVKRDE